MSFLRQLATKPIIGGAIRLAGRARVAAPYVMAPVYAAARWLFTSNELGNFTYKLTPLNRQYLIAMLSQVTGTTERAISAYMDELDADDALREHVRTTTSGSAERVFADTKRVEFGRRIGWYALVRAAKPSVVIETGVDKGLGACVLCAALLRNKQDGKPGRYYGTDINPAAGYLLRGKYAEVGTMLYGDSIESLRAFRDPIDVLINDSDHSADYELREYGTVASKLTSHSYVLGDNSHASPSLLSFARDSNRRFLFFREEPAGHWYPGAGIGIAFGRSDVTQ